MLRTELQGGNTWCIGTARLWRGHIYFVPKNLLVGTVYRYLYPKHEPMPNIPDGLEGFINTSCACAAPPMDVDIDGIPRRTN